MKRVPAEEFARHAAEYLEGTEPVSVEKDGEVIGQYVPTSNGHGSNGTRSDEIGGKTRLSSGNTSSSFGACFRRSTLKRA